MLLGNTKERNKISKLVIVCVILTLLLYVFINCIINSEAYALTQTREEYSESRISTYPGYKELITRLKNAHPNWKFTILYTGLDWNQVIKSETVALHGRSVVPASWSSPWKCQECGDTPRGGSSWRCASEAAVAYYMDPRNWLNDEYIFQFERLSFNSNGQTVDGVKKIIADMHYMDGDKASYVNTSGQRVTLNKSFAQVIYDAAKDAGISPYHLASRIRQEQGAGDSPGATATGTYGGYVGYYNYLNIGASGGPDSEVIENGLSYAKSKGWTDPEKSIRAGAVSLAEDYIKDGQDTLYLQKFDVDYADKSLYSWQYMQNIAAATNESTSVKDTYRDLNFLDSSIDFVIPVYENMPSTISPQPGTGSGNTTQTTVTGDKVQVICPSGLRVRMEPGTNKDVVTAVDCGTILTRTRAGVSNADGYTWDEIMTSNGIKGYVARGDSSEAYIKVISTSTNNNLKIDKTNLVCEPATTVDNVKSKYSGKSITVKDSKGNTITSGNIGTGYKITVDNTTYTVVKKGDTNGDGVINTGDTFLIKQIIMKVKQLSSDEFKMAADINGDGQINTGDSFILKKQVMNVSNITL